MWFFNPSKSRMIRPEEALPGRESPLRVSDRHHVFGRPFVQVPEGLERMMVGMGCFWGAERKFWQVPGVWATAVGYAAGYTKNPTYEEVCTGKTGHNEVVLIHFDPSLLTYDRLLQVFWENHDPTQGFRQGNDVGTQYRSGLYLYTSAQRISAESSRDRFQARLSLAGYGPITTEIFDAPPFYYAEDYHQQYLSKNPGGYCGLGGTGVKCAEGVGG